MRTEFNQQLHHPEYANRHIFRAEHKIQNVTFRIEYFIHFWHMFVRNRKH